MEAEYKKRLDGYLFRDDYMPLRGYGHWALSRGHGDFAALPADVRRIIYRMCRKWYRLAIPNALIGGRGFEGHNTYRYYTPDTPLGYEMSKYTEFGKWASARLFPRTEYRRDDGEF